LSLADLAEIRALDAEALETRRREAKEELFRLRVQHATLQLTATSRLGELRREIAQIMTVQRERELVGAAAGDEVE
jgi:large subunit ribosomal protein L29